MPHDPCKLHDSLCTSRRCSTKILYVGHPEEFEAVSCVSSGAQASVALVGYDDVTHALLDALQPDVIYSPLLTARFDTADLALKLQTLGFKGHYCAVVKSVPLPHIIKDEVRRMAPAVNYDLLMTEIGLTRLH